MRSSLVHFFLGYVQSQNDKEVYSEGTMHFMLVDDDGGIWADWPMAKNVTIIKDTFFKSYSIRGESADGRIGVELRYIQTIDGIYRMKDEKGVIYLVDDGLEKHGQLYEKEEKKLEKDGKIYNKVFFYENFKREKK